MKKINILLKELDKLNLPKGSYVIIGSGPMWIRGIREIGDLDILIRKDIFNKLKASDNLDTSKHEYGHLMFGEIELAFTWQDSEEKAIKIIWDAEIIHDYPFAKLEYIIERKKEKNREKDQKDIKLILEYLKNHRQ